MELAMKAIASIFALGSALVVASTVFAADTSSQPLTRADCGTAGMRWNEGGANVCAEPTSTAGQTESSAVFAADTSSQPLTRADCGKAGMRWNEGANVCAEPTSTAALAGVTPSGEHKAASQAGPGRTPGRKSKVASWAGPGSRYVQAGPSWYGRGDQPQRRRGFFGRLFGGP
jgi:hypothetical protein